MCLSGLLLAKLHGLVQAGVPLAEVLEGFHEAMDACQEVRGPLKRCKGTYTAGAMWPGASVSQHRRRCAGLIERKEAWEAH